MRYVSPLYRGETSNTPLAVRGESLEVHAVAVEFGGGDEGLVLVQGVGRGGRVEVLGAAATQLAHAPEFIARRIR